MNFHITSISSKNLKRKQVQDICKLKDQEWKFGIKAQVKWYKQNIKKFDIHNLLYINSKLIGYTLLRKRLYKILNTRKLMSYYLFDTLIIDEKYRRKNLSSLIMNFNNSVIKQSGLLSFLVCKKQFLSFYKKYRWKNLDREKFVLLDNKNFLNGMIFNQKKNYKKYFFFQNKL